MGARVSSRAHPNPNLSQVTTNQPAPSWADKELWRTSTWYVRLALRLRYCTSLTLSLSLTLTPALP